MDLRSSPAAATSAPSFGLQAHLEFADWLEALLRLAATIALPTDEELRAAGADDAAGFLSRLAPKAYRAFLEAHRQRGEHERTQRQPVWRCMHHLMDMVGSRHATLDVFRSYR